MSATTTVAWPESNPSRCAHIAAWAPCALIGAVGGALVLAAARNVLIDDAFITIDYARTLAFHGQWGMQPGVAANTATSPANVLLLAALTAIIRRPVAAVGILLVLSLAVSGGALAALCRHLGWSRWPAVVAVGLLTVNPLLVSTIGLETYLALAVIAVLSWALVTGRIAVAGAMCGLLLLVRADLLAFSVAGLLATVVMGRRVWLRQSTRLIGVAAVVAVPWYAVSWWWLGSAVPDTFLIKLSESMGDRTFANGLWFFGLGYPFAVVASLMSAVAGLLVLVVWMARGRATPQGAAILVVFLGLGAVLHVGVYLMLGSAPYQWYYGPAIGALSMLAPLGLAPSRAAVRRSVLSVLGVVVVTTGCYLVVRPWTLTTITGNWATPTEYAALATRAPEGAVVRSFGEVGTVVYFCDCIVSDRLADRGEFAQLLATRRASAGPLTRMLYDINYYNFDVPAPLRATLDFTFADDPSGVPATSWRGDVGRMVIRPRA